MFVVIMFLNFGGQVVIRPGHFRPMAFSAKSETARCMNMYRRVECERDLMKLKLTDLARDENRFQSLDYGSATFS
jgi:hypothetical protein